ncbi:hypothetical protein FJZ26_05735 [Candidatus Parvarchaeota archaeon]|nr:hypothetical protein [Candidatus Parvarchaeota archaeon]
MPEPLLIFSNVYLGWESLIILASFSTFFLVTLFYMLAYAFNLQNLKKWCKAEYMEVLATLVIALLLIGFIDIGLGATSSFTRNVVNAAGLSNYGTGSNPSPFDITRGYLNESIGCIKSVYRVMYAYNFYVEFLEKISQDIGGTEPVAGTWYKAGLVSLFHYLANRVTYVLVFQYFQFRLTDFFEATMLTLFLPVGLILRTFPLTRGVGGFLIALAIGCYIIFPLSYLMIIAIQGNVAGGCNIQNLPVIKPNTICPGSLPQAYMQLQRENKDINSIADAASVIANYIGTITMQSLFYPLIALIMVFTFVRQTSKLLGADLAELGHGLVKLI